MPISRVRARGAIVALALAAAPVLAGPASAASHPPSPSAPWMGTFAVTIEGTQSDSWSLHHEPTDQCDARRDGSGKESDDIRVTGGPVAVATGVGPSVQSVSSVALTPATVTMTRDGSIAEVAPTPADPDACPSFSGGGDATPPPASGCGSRSGTLSLLLTPAPLGLHVTADDSSLTATPFESCPNLGTALPTLVGVDLHALAAAVPPGGGPSVLTLSGDATIAGVADPEVSTAATIHLEARLTGAAISTDISATDADVPVSSSGVTRVDLRCPRRASAACRGTLGEFLTAVDPPTTLPAPVPSGAQRLGRATPFAIAAGHHEVVRIVLPHGTQVSSFADLTLPIVLTQKDRKGRRLAVVVALAHAS